MSKISVNITSLTLSKMISTLQVVIFSVSVLHIIEILFFPLDLVTMLELPAVLKFQISLIL